MRKKIPTPKRVIKILHSHYQPIPLETYGTDPFKTLVSTLLSARTRDETTFRVCEHLFKKVKSFHQIVQLPNNQIAKLIYPVGFYQQKAKNLSETAKIIAQKYGGQVPDKLEKLIKLPGVGRKTANLILARVFGKPVISVDTHVHKIANLLGWVNTKTPEQTEKELMKVVPKRYWRSINRLFVSIGRQFRSKKKLVEFLRENHLITY